LAFPIESRALAFDDDSGMRYKRRKLDDECRDGKRRAVRLTPKADIAGTPRPLLLTNAL
jgi:hypothetical protein